LPLGLLAALSGIVSYCCTASFRSIKKNCVVSFRSPVETPPPRPAMQPHPPAPPIRPRAPCVRPPDATDPLPMASGLMAWTWPAKGGGQQHAPASQPRQRPAACSGQQHSSRHVKSPTAKRPIKSIFMYLVDKSN
jgi:hypothetical protein